MNTLLRSAELKGRVIILSRSNNKRFVLKQIDHNRPWWREPERVFGPMQLRAAIETFDALLLQLKQEAM